MKIFDLHCDLLAYLSEDPSHQPHDLQARCAIPQLLAGGVQHQVMAIFAETALGSQQKGLEQFRHYQMLPNSISTLLAIENASALCGEDESLTTAFERLSHMHHNSALAYISLTWNFENRFGGGALSKGGLKRDGKLLLEWMQRHRVAIDLSHASDALAFDIFNEIECRGYDLPVIASHSNFRAVTNVPRNLPDEIAKEIIRKKGVIGLCLVHSFIGHDDITFFAEHVAHGLALGGENHLSFGADFFFEGSLPESSRIPGKQWYFKDFDNATIYGRVLAMLDRTLNWSQEQKEKMAFRNAENLFKTQVTTNSSSLRATT